MPAKKPERFGDPAPGFRDLDHADKEAIERLRLAGHCLAERIAALDGHRDPPDDRAKSGAGELLRKVRERLADIHARVLIGSELAAERRELAGADAAKEN